MGPSKLTGLLFSSDYLRVGVPGAPKTPDDQVADGTVGAGLVLSADLLHLFAQSLLPECSRLSNSSFHSSRHTPQAARVWAVRPLLSAGPGGVVR